MILRTASISPTALAPGGRCSPRIRHRVSFAPRSKVSAFSSIPTLPVDEVTIDCQSRNKTHFQSELQAIVEPYHRKHQPVVVRGVAKETPATKLWSSWDYLRNTAIDDDSDPMVAVEIGGSYGIADSTRAEIPFSAYLQFLQLFEERHGRYGSLPGETPSANESDIPTEELVYMAQNDLLAPLYKDVLIPDFCQNGKIDNLPGDGTDVPAFESTEMIGLGRLYSVMMWFGPRGCVSPLHYDPLDNCFLQHLGRKRVLLFDPSCNGSGWHYAAHEGQQSNTSPIDPQVLDDYSISDGGENIDETNTLLKDYRKKYPIFFEEAPQRLECLLEPGDLLYIPSRWWHHVRSIDTSASVNVWWR